jgi:hypothetical protein
VSRILGEFGRGSQGRPDLIPTVTQKDAAEGQHRLSIIPAPAHPGLFHPFLHDHLAPGLDRATSDRITVLTELLIMNAGAMGKDIIDDLPDFLG